MADYLYRGVDLSHGTPPVLSEQRIEGENPLIVEGAAPNRNKTVTRNTTLAELEDQVRWAQRETHRAGVTGGVTHRIMGSARFGGGKRTRVILRSGALPFERVYYEYDWMDDHPGALAHILTTSAGELRVQFEGLWAIITKTNYGPEKWRSLPFEAQYKIDHWGPDSLPATSSGSRFAEESEWVAMTDEVDVSGAIDSVVHVIEDNRIRDKEPERAAFDVLHSVEEDHPETQNHPHYVLVVNRRHKQSGGPYGIGEIAAAYGRKSGGGRRPGDSAFPIEPADVPDHVRGLQ